MAKRRRKSPDRWPTVDRPTPGRAWPAAVALVLLVVVTYLPTWNSDFIWDDDDYVLNNQTLHGADGLRRIWFELGAVPQYYPLVHTTFWVEYRLWGLHPRGYHLVNVALHALAAVLAWRLLGRLRVPGAWLAAAVFAVHPVGVESVAWVTERKNVLSMTMALGSLLAYLRFSPPELPAKTVAPERPAQAWCWYVLSLGMYLGALWSKTITASVPAVLLVIYWWKRGRIDWREAIRLAPFFAVGLWFASITAWMEREVVGAQGADWDLSPVERVLIAGRAVWFYAGKLCWPHPLVFFYPRWQIDTAQTWQYVFPAAALAVVVVLWLARGRIGRGPLAAVLIFGGVLTPALGFFDVFPFRYSFVADHFQYHASLALIVLAVAGAVLAARRVAPRALWAPQLVAAAVLALLASVAFARTFALRDLPTLWQDTIAKNPASPAAHNNLGNYLRLQRDYAGALRHLQEAVRLDPERGSARGNLGAVLIDLGRYDEAIAVLQADLAIQPASHQSLYNYGVALAAQGDFAAGIERVQRALAIRPGFDSAWHELGAMLVAQGRPREAIAPHTEAVRLQPRNIVYRQSLAKSLLALGQSAAAEEHLREALRIEPRNADSLTLLGMVMLARRDYNAAERYLGEALTIDPQHASAKAALEQLRQQHR